MLYLKTIKLLFFLPLLGCTSTPHAWQGQAGSKRIFIELQTTPEGINRAFLSLPEQWVNNAEADSLILSDKDILAIVERDGIQFEGTFHSGKDSIRAKVTTYGKTREFNLGKVDSLQPLCFPQNPRPPYPYRSEDITYTSCDSIQVAGTLTVPQGKGRGGDLLSCGQTTGERDRQTACMKWLPREILPVMRKQASIT